MLLEKLQSDSIEALKTGNKQKLSVLRMLVSEVKNSQIDIIAAGKELTDDDVLKVLAKELKKRKDSIEAYNKAGRSDLSEVEESEAKIISEYLPQQMSETDVEAIVSEVISGGATDFGSVMKGAMAKIAGRADGKLVSEVVKRLLS